ncbi:MAG TPA: SDR family oxidoreductase, partial [Gemmatales bacterium]|nr:SDR family oxidoreductase [Gemmatales bacterium]
MRFIDRIVIITGAGSGIGLAAAKRIGSEGGRVVLVDLHQDKVNTSAQEVLSAGAPETWATVCDVSKEAEVIATVAETINRFGRIDVIVNCAGFILYKPLAEHTQEDWLKILGVDLLGPFYFIKQAFRVMRPGGAIVNVSSIHAEMTTPLVASYAAAKAGLVSLTRSTAIEGKPLGIRVNAILPGAIDTPMLWNNPNIKSGVEYINPADVGKPEDVAGAIAYLASDDASFVQGEA